MAHASAHSQSRRSREDPVWCQCPMAGSRLCTLVDEDIEASIEDCVNALCRAHVFAQNAGYLELAEGKAVSMPYVGLTSLHLLGMLVMLVGLSCVNALSRASLISMEKYHEKKDNDDSVSMPLVGRASFLHTAQEAETETTTETVSMPLVGRASFLQKFKGIKIMKLSSVSMPLVGRASFLRKKLGEERARKVRACQCP